MDAGMGILIVLVIAGLAGIVKLIEASNAASVRQGAEREVIRLSVEKRVLQLIAEFPMFDDGQIMLTLRDELTNRRASAAWFMWATIETVGRLRRTIIIETLRAEREEK